MIINKSQIITWLEKTVATIEENKTYLTDLDSPIGDADHGTNMNRGFKSVMAKLPTIKDTDIGNILKTTGMTLMSSVGGASGPLFGTFYIRCGLATTCKEELNKNDLLQMFESGVAGILERGRAQLEDKTMYDAWAPALDAMRKAMADNANMFECLKQTVAAAKQGMIDTIPLQARKGRASYLGERSIGHQDPGATSTYLILKQLLEVVQE